MKTLHVPFHFYPDSVGGTEVYALALARRLARAGDQVHIAAPGDRRTDYEYEGLPVHRFTSGALADISGLYGKGDALATRQFVEIVDAVSPEIVHLHAMSPAISLSLVREVKQRGIPVILTVHIPGILCARGTLLQYGSDVCDGTVEVGKCSRCVLQSRGLPRALADAGGSLPVRLGEVLAATRVQSGWMTALRMRQLIAMRTAALRAFLAEVDHIVAVSEWMKDTLMRNSVSRSRITLCRHGVTQVETPAQPTRGRQESGEKKIAYFGRLDKTKGAHILVEAVLRSPNLPLRLDIYGIKQDEPGWSYAERLISRSSHDRRIRFLPPASNDEVPRIAGDYDAIGIPSIWMETGPLVVYDAFSAGTPVIGSRRGGIAELVEHERNGLLVDPPGSVEAWIAALTRICREPGLADRLRRGITPPRTMDAVAAEMIALYSSILERRGVDHLCEV